MQDSIPAYVARCSHFLAIVPTVRHNDLPDVTCDYGSWLDRGWCRIEMWALMLSVYPLRGTFKTPLLVFLTVTEVCPCASSQGTCQI